MRTSESPQSSTPHQQRDAEGSIMLDGIVAANHPRISSGTIASPPPLRLGMLMGFESAGTPLVSIDPDEDLGGPIPALSTVSTTLADVGRHVVLAPVIGGDQRPLILGFLETPSYLATTESSLDAREAGPAILVDGKSLRIDGRERVELRCGKASIVLTSDGEVRIRGTNVVSRASATNRIRGGNVQIN